MIRSRMELAKDTKQDLYAAAAGELKPGGERLRGTQLWSEATFFMAAGASTVSSLMAAISFYLSRNPRVYDRVTSEVRKTFASGQEIHAGPKLGSCTYLRAVIDETLRITPVSIGVLWREQASALMDRPFIVDGYTIPPGVVVGLSPYSLLHNEKYFPDPFTFSPERFLDAENGQLRSSEEAAKAVMRHAFAPFAVGNRNCAGRALAYLESTLVVAYTLWYFDFKVAPGEEGKLGGGAIGARDGRDRPDEYQLYDNIAADHGPNLIFTRRNEYWIDLVKEEHGI